MLAPAEDALADPNTIEPNRERIAIIHRNALRLLKLVNSMLDFTRIEAGRVQATFEPTDFPAFVADVASTFRSVMERAGLRFTVDAPAAPATAPPIYIDHDMWEKIVLNLLSNAFKHTFEGAVEVHASVDQHGATLSVRDTGVGIPTDELPRIFERFHRVPNARSRTHEGSGIGLALVQELVRLHGGRVDVTSTPGEGTTFTVVIPAGRAHLAAERVVESRDERRQIVSGSAAYVEEASRWLPDGEPGGGASTGDAVARHGRIIVADDNADMRDYVVRLLRDAGHHVVAAADGRAALEQALAAPPDLILSDVMMPRLDGFELLAALREHDATRDVPVVLLSARAGEESRVEGMLSGATDYLIKPFSSRELIARVDAHLMRALAVARERREAKSNAQLLEAVQRESARLEELFAQAPAAIAILVGPDFVYETANEEYRRIVHGRHVLGKPILEALPEIRGQGIIELLEGVRRTGRPHIGNELRVKLVDAGELRDHYFNFVYSPIVETNGDVSGIFVHAVDVTDQVLARREAEEANRAKSEFLAAMSHELRTPLNAIAGYAQLVMMGVHGPVTNAQREALERLLRSEQHLLSLVNDVLNFAKLEAGRVEYNFTAVPVRAVVEGVRTVVEPQIAAARLAFPVGALPDAAAWADADKVQQILINLLSNAAKFTPAGGEVAIRAAVRDGDGRRWVDIAVSDTGIGIPADRQASVFDPFVQVHRRLTTSTEGTGLGLAISRDLARGMDGDLSVESVEGKGSTFTLSLPAAPPR
jgi:signal transduction histidine kinase